MAAAARWCFRHGWVVILLWLIALAGAALAGTRAGDAYADNFEMPGAEASAAADLLGSAVPERSGDSATVVWSVDHGSVTDPEVRGAMSDALERVARLPDVGSVTGPYAPPGGEDAARLRAAEERISDDGATAYATVTFTRAANELDADRVDAFIDTARAPAGELDGLAVEVGGQAAGAGQERGGHAAELVGLVAAAVVLYLAFGSLFGMVLPLVIALFGVGIGTMTTALLSHALEVAEVAPTLGTLVGLGVGIDYALFVVTRHRAGLRRGLTPEDAAVASLNTSGRAVLFAGATVCVALMGLCTLGISFLYGLAVATTLVVALVVLAAVTLLPALLRVFGPRVLSRRERRRLAAEGPASVEPTGAAARWSGFTQRHPRALAAAALAVLAVLAIPTLSLRLGASDQGNDPADSTTRRAYDMLAEGFGPGFNGPLQIVAETPTEADRQALDALVADLAADEGVARATPLPTVPDAGVSVIEVIPTTAPQDEGTDALIDRLRDEVIPAAVADTGVEPLVGGQTAVFKDFAAGIMAELPLFVGVIVALGFVLLLVAFRSLVVPLTAAAMNLVAAAASFGLLVAVFQWGWGSEALDAGPGGPVESFLPVIMLSLLFGLSMDYQVFLISRIHEEWTHTRDNHRAVRVGLAETSRVINSAAVIMICVFAAFVLRGERVTSEFGVGLAGAVALDAFLIRTVLVPALMHLLGRANWWLPRWLERRLPHLAVEPPAPAPAPAGPETGPAGQERAVPERPAVGGVGERPATPGSR